MASRLPLADPSGFAIGVAVGYAHVLERVLGFLDQEEKNPILLVLLALIAYLLLAIAMFAVCVAADGLYYHRIVERRDVNVTPEQEQAAAALSPAAVLGCIGNLALAVAILALAVAILALAAAFLIFSFVLARRL